MLSTIESSLLFDGVDKQIVKGIVPSLVQEDWDKGQRIMGPSDSAASFRLVAQGRAKIVCSNSRDGRELTLWLLGRGDAFDVACLLDGKPHAITAWAIDPVRTLAAPTAVWSKWLRSHPSLCLALQRYTAARLRAAGELAEDLALHDTTMRLSRLLLRHFGGGKSNLLDALPQRELASAIGSVRIVVSRVLARMSEQGIVDLRRGTVHAVDIDRLRKWIEADSEDRYAVARSARRAGSR